MNAPQRWVDSRRAFTAVAGFALSLSLALPATAQTATETLRQHDRELESLRSEQKKSEETRAKLSEEIDAIGSDRRRLNQALLDTAARLSALEEQIAATEARLDPLNERERALRQSLRNQRSTIAELLAALQRMGRRPPPAIMVSPEDALRSVRTAIMLGTVLPEMRGQAEALAGDLTALVEIRKQIATEKERLIADLGARMEERQRIAALVGERQKRQAETESALEAERRKAIALARQVDNLKDLIGKAEQALDGANRAARSAERAALDQGAGARTDLAALKDPGRLAPAIEFAAARGHLPLPVTGTRIREFGGPDALGGTEKGLTIAARAGGQVVAPCDGWVVYAASFRNYGQVLILNAGGGYHVVLAGMEQISVNVGQFVLTGEPVAVMGNAKSAPSGPNSPALYVEFRKDGTPVDPSPWWAASEGKKARG